ncbi:unnamed protein product, partial [Ascophyllum nodosum]
SSFSFTAHSVGQLSPNRSSRLTVEKMEQPQEVADAGFLAAVKDTFAFYRCIFYFLCGGKYKKCTYFTNRLQARVQCYSLALVFYLWSKPHYRNSTFKEDMRKNLRNVAIPGSGVPISYFCSLKATAFLFIVVINPIACLVGAFNEQRKHGRPWAQTYVEQLLRPQDWFSFWRLNCRLASYHAFVTGSKGYCQEDKWTFLRDGKSKGVPISPFLDVPAVVIKDKNEEGGMGLFFFKNATEGGDWIIQERLENDAFVTSLLPDNAPLSTMRVISASRWWLEQRAGETPGPECIKSLSCVFRAGRQGADTDHSSILFDVDAQTGTILKGTTNAHWYQLGPGKVFSTPWTSTHDATHHPDNNKLITGQVIPDITAKLDLVADAHFKLLPDVPLVGWDVALTTKGVCLLEVNLSCNFFRGSFSLAPYVQFVHDYFIALEEERTAHGKVE